MVRETALESLISLLDGLPDGSKTGQVVPFLRKAFHRLSIDPLDPLAVVFSKQLGALLGKLSKLFTDDDFEVMCKSFKVAATGLLWQGHGPHAPGY